MMLMKRRDFLKVGAAAGAVASLYGCAAGNKAGGHVVVVGGGFGGATVAKYLRMWSEGSVQVTLIERNPSFVSCPISNLVIGGSKTMEDITVSYDNLKSMGCPRHSGRCCLCGCSKALGQARQGWRPQLRPPCAFARH